MDRNNKDIIDKVEGCKVPQLHLPGLNTDLSTALQLADII